MVMQNQGIKTELCFRASHSKTIRLCWRWRPTALRGKGASILINLILNS